MATKAELEKQVKELKEIIRAFKETAKDQTSDASQLPNVQVGAFPNLEGNLVLVFSSFDENTALVTRTETLSGSLQSQYMKYKQAQEELNRENLKKGSK